MICETWNGIILQERNTIATLKSKFPDINFVKTSGYFDHKYAVDYELFIKEKLQAALQIKPKSYLFDKPYIIKAKNTNEKKNQEYRHIFGCSVFTVISDKYGHIHNPEIIQTLNDLLEKAKNN